MKTFTIEVRGKKIPVYVDTLTKQMAVRFGRETSGIHAYEVPCNYHHGIWTTNVGIFGCTIEELIINYIMYTYPRLTDLHHIYVCDDMEVFNMPSEPVNGMISYNEIKDVDSIKW